jgi:hypothetical protein
VSIAATQEEIHNHQSESENRGFMTARDLMTTGDYMTISYSIDNTPDESEPKSKMPMVAIFGKKELFPR